MHDVDWSAPGICRVVGLLFADAFGFFGSTDERTRVETVGGRTCLVGGFVALAIEGISDVDATVELELTVDRSSTAALLVGYDANETPENKRRVDVPPGKDRWATVTVPLERARFAGRGPRRTDVLLGAPAGDFGSLGDPTTALMLSSISVRARSTSPLPAIDAAIELEVRDEAGAPTSARIGLYAVDGREVL
ncbi:MAG: hypothetical protein ACXVPR_10410, partial [Actinomycetota bacterium]